LGADVAGEAVGEFVDAGEGLALEQAGGQGGGESVAGADGVYNFDGEAVVVGGFFR
jgi:hypothetical protein